MNMNNISMYELCINNKVNDVYTNLKSLYFTRIERTNLLLFKEFAIKPRYTYKLP